MSWPVVKCCKNIMEQTDERASGRVEEERQCARACSLACVTDKWQETNREPVPWLMFVMSLGAGAAVAILEIQLCKIVQFC